MIFWIVHNVSIPMCLTINVSIQPKGQTRMDYPETLAILGTQDENKQQMISNTDPTKT